jgi:hypothetical protein
LLEASKQPRFGTAPSAGFTLRTIRSNGAIVRTRIKGICSQIRARNGSRPIIKPEGCLGWAESVLDCPVTSWLEFLLIKCVHMRLFCYQPGQTRMARLRTRDRIVTAFRVLCRSWMPRSIDCYVVVSAVIFYRQEWLHNCTSFVFQSESELPTVT